MNLNRLILGPLLLLVVAATLRAADEGAVTPDLQSSPPIVEPLLSDVNNSVRAVDVDSLQKAERLDLFELSRQTSGVAPRRLPGVDLDPQVRGYHSWQTNVSFNGARLILPLPYVNGFLCQSPFDLVQRVTSIEGPYSSLYGPGLAFVAADLFQSERYAEPEVHGRASFFQESNGGLLSWRESLWGGGKSWSLWAGYGQQVGNDYRPGGASDDFRVPASFNRWDTTLALSLSLSDWSRVELNYLHTEDNNVELPGVAYDVARAKSDLLNVRYVLQENPSEPERLVFQYWWNRTPYRGDATHESKQRTVFRRFITDNFAGLAPPLDDFNVSNLTVNGELLSQGTRALLTFGAGESSQLVVGADWRRYRQRNFERALNALGQPAFVDSGSGLNNAVFIPGVNEGPVDDRGVPESRMEDFGLLAHLWMPIKERWSATIGGRADFTTASALRSDSIATDSLYSSLVGFGEPTDPLGMGYGTLRYAVTPQLSVDAGVGYAMRSPTLSELYSDLAFAPALRFPSQVLGNSELRPERDLQFDLGVTQKWERVSVRGRGFFATIDDYILPLPIQVQGGMGSPFNLGRQIATGAGTVAVPDSAAVVYQYANIGRATLAGTDLTIRARPADWLTLDGMVGYVRGVNHTPLVATLVNGPNPTTILSPANKGAEPLPNLYPLYATVGVWFHDPDADRWSIGWIARMTQGQHAVADGLGELSTPGYMTVGVAANYRLSKHARLRTAIDNLFDRSYTEAGSYAIINRAGGVSFVKEPGISWTLGLEAEF